MRQHGSVLTWEICQVVNSTIIWADEGAKETAQTALHGRVGFVGPCPVNSVTAIVTLNAEKLVHAGVASSPVVDSERTCGQPLLHSIETMLADIGGCCSEQRATHGLMNSVVPHL